jgi:hypothetical protein
MRNNLAPSIAAMAALVLMGGIPAEGANVIGPPVSVTGPTFGDPYTVDKLFDSVVTAADINITAYGGINGQWAGPGAGPHTLFMDFGSSITASGLAYSQRLGNDPVADKVGTVEFWFSDSDFLGVTPGDAPSAIVSLTNTTDTVLTSYDLGGVYSGRYVAARFTAASLLPPTNNPGGTEMRFLAPIPEPSTVVLMTLVGMVGAAVLRRSRRAGEWSK